MLCESDSSDPKYHEREGECTTLEEGGRKPVKKGGTEEGREGRREGRKKGGREGRREGRKKGGSEWKNKDDRN